MNKLKSLLLACVITAGFLATADVRAASSNTIVRFQIKYGTTLFGNVDVELFDYDKPVTVSNFLSYVRSGAFDRTFFHRVVPGFVLQGGQYTVDNPYGQALFESAKLITEGPAITNEYRVGPVISNKFGTIAMAKIENQPNSATTSWFFNLADNSDNLDYQNGGFTVFGRVKAGSSILSRFNNISESRGIINMVGIDWLFSPCNEPMLGTNFLTLDSLPVAFYSFFDCPYYSDLFHVQISIISGGDTTPPKVGITTPGRNQSITNSVINFSGPITDASATNTVRLYPGTNQPVDAEIVNNTWSVTLTNLLPGTNQFLVEATDRWGNRSTTFGQFFRSFSAPLGVFLAGTGTGVTLGPTNGQMLEVGKGYTLTAVPDPGNLFVSWAGGFYFSGSPTLSFVMETNLALTARIETNLFPFVTGTYNGLLVNPEQAEQRHSGYFTLKLADKGAYTAKLMMNGRTIPLSGFFNTQGTNSVILSLPGIPGSSRVNLGVDLIGGSDLLVGSITNTFIYTVSNYITTNITTYTTNGGVVETNTYTTNYWTFASATEGWSANILADRVVFNARTNPAPFAGRYTLVFPADTNSTNSPFGDGYGTATISTAGALTFAGSLADGTKVSQKTTVSKNGTWPLYLPLYKTNGSLVSWVTFTNKELTDLDGLYNWFKRAHVSKYYPGGFTNEATIAGSLFVPPNTTNRMLNLTSTIVGLTNGNLSADFTNHVTLDAKGKVTNLGSNRLSLSISSGKGTFSGSATPPAGGRSVSFKGVVLQKQTNASGFFLGTNASGRISLGQ